MSQINKTRKDINSYSFFLYSYHLIGSEQINISQSYFLVLKLYGSISGHPLARWWTLSYRRIVFRYRHIPPHTAFGLRMQG